MEEAPQHFDFAILGGGSAGYAAARTAASLNLHTAVIDGAEELGGLCILRGCMPSKTLIETANRALVLRNAGEFGLSRPQFQEVDTRFVRFRKRRLIHEFASYRQEQLQQGRFELIRGTGTFESAEGDILRLRIQLREGGEKFITAGSVLIATGSVISVPKISGLSEAGYWTSDTLLDVEEIPPAITVLGGGAIALEMAHYLEAIGRKVNVIQRSPQLLRGMDPGAAQVVKEAFEQRGMKIHTGTELGRVEKTAQGKRVYFQQDGADKFVDANEVLVALGRKPATSSLALEKTGAQITQQGSVVVSATMQSANPRIFAAGDVCGPLEVVHLAIQQGEIAARNAAAILNGLEPKEKIDYRCKLYGVFTHPQVAAVGLTEEEAKEQGLSILTASYPFNDHGKSMVMGETDGFVKLIASAENGTLLGGVVVGPEATELIHEIVVAMHFNATARSLSQVPHYHPTLSEIWTYPAEEIADQIP